MMASAFRVAARAGQCPARTPWMAMGRAMGMAMLLLVLVAATALAQTQPTRGIERRDERVDALVGARILVGDGSELVGTVLVRDGRIAEVGADVEVPPEARVHDLAGRVITAGWIELDFPLRVQAAGNDDDARVARAWNARVHPELDAVLSLPLPDQRSEELRKVGFTLAVIAPDRGLFAGQGALVGLGSAADANAADDDALRTTVVRDGVGVFARLEHGSWPQRIYPNSRMGAVALLRQTLHDADWYQRVRDSGAEFMGVPAPELNRSLEALEPVLSGQTPLALRTDDVLEIMVLERVLGEFPRVRPWYLGTGEEYLWLGELSAFRGEPRIALPLDFPEAPAIERPDQAERVTLRRLELWARAPENPIRLHRAGIEAAFTTRGLKKKKQFPERVRRVIERGFDRAQALAAVTRIPARMLGAEKQLGSVTAGNLAYLTVLDGEPFAEDTRTVEVWIAGRRYPTERRAAPDLDGPWQFTFALPAGDTRLDLAIRNSRKRPRLEWRGVHEGHSGAASLRVEAREVSITLDGEPLSAPGFVTMSGHVDPGYVGIVGTALLPDGMRVRFEATRNDAPEVSDDVATPELPAWGPDDALAAPLGARGRVGGPFAPDSVLVQGATIWTLGPRGTVEDADLLVHDGKVVAVGDDIEARAGAHVLDGRGLHVTPGLIDPHSHTAITSGTNESTQSVTAEVRIGDVIRPHDMNLYRQLAGGVTTSQLLHGSANPIGGQSAIIKLRWGEDPEDMKLSGAPPTIKFALGENVKQSNWGDEHTTRYPQTRMGVAQILRDRFLAARQYEKEKRENPHFMRIDLELEALVEILNGERFIHCHAYRQDEMLALMRLAEQLGFRVGTFHHVLEGYKIGPEMARHGASATSFSDWWAYKFEVYDAIPYNGALLRQAGVLTSFNSDDNELARRLNLEAAKAVKYGGVPRDEALAFVSLNPARQLRVADRIGSLESGKDADFVLWSGDPLSGYSRCLETWIDGKRYFQVAEDAELAARDATRKRELVQAVIGERHAAREKRRQQFEDDPDADPDANRDEEDP